MSIFSIAASFLLDLVVIPTQSQSSASGLPEGAGRELVAEIMHYLVEHFPPDTKRAPTLNPATGDIKLPILETTVRRFDRASDRMIWKINPCSPTDNKQNPK